MKQLDLIVSAACIVIGFVAVLILVSTRRQPVPAPQVPQINTEAVQLPNTPVTMTSGLPGAPGGGMGAGGKGGKKGGGFMGS